MSEVRKFKTESKKLLDLMVNSIYTDKDIFLREVISNASDAIDKYHYLSLTNDKLPAENDFKIDLSIDSKARTITIKDNGIGMTHDDLIDSLGTIAKSGSEEFMEKLKEVKNKPEIIGQFGVGFYSIFMVTSKVELKTRSLLDTKGYIFKSNGQDHFTIDETEQEDSGTEITLFLKKNDDDFEYDKYLDEWTIKSLVKKYSDYIRYPIKMMVSTSKLKEGTKDKFEDVLEEQTLNTMTPLWKKNKSEVKDEEYNEFYKQKYSDYQDPLMHILVNVEGKVNYTALLYIPKAAPYNLYSEKYEKGYQLYTKGVFILDKCKELVPDYLRFVKGVVDSSDLDLNISREMLQKSKQLKEIGDNLEKKVISRLKTMMKNEFDQYLEFYKSFGVNIKFGVYDEYGAKKEMLQDMLLYNTINQDKMITLKDYVANMKADQKCIYFASGKNKDIVMALPQMDVMKKHGYDVLILPDDVDEFLMSILVEYDKKKFQSINQGDLDLLDKDEEKKFETLNEEKKPILDAIKESLKDKVDDVKLSKRLTDSAVCLVSGDGVSFEMEKALANTPANQGAKAKKILELNPTHELFKALESIYLNNPSDINDYADLLYSQALLIEGFKLENPTEFSKKMCDLIVKANK